MAGYNVRVEKLRQNAVAKQRGAAKTGPRRVISVGVAESESIRTPGSKVLAYLNGCTSQRSTLAPVSVALFAGRSLNAPEAECGSNPSPAQGRHFVARYSVGPASTTEGSPRRKEIMLVEDNTGDVFLVREALGEHGVECELLVATDGEKAITFIDSLDSSETPCPSLVILDLNLPKKTGLDVLRRIRASRTCGHVPVVILSSSDAPRDRQEALMLGATRYVRKPPLLPDFMKIGGILKGLLGDVPE